MQPVPACVFPELQREAQAQAQEARRRSRAPSEGGGRLGSQPPTKTRQSPVSLTATDRSISSPSSPAALQLGDAKPVPTKRKTARRRSSTVTQQSEHYASLGSELRSGAQPAPSWSESAQAMSPQFLGSATASNANLSITRPVSPQLSVKQYKSTQLATTAAQLQCFLSQSSALPPAPVHLPPVVESLLLHSRPPSLHAADHQFSSPPETPSDTSSFAYTLIRRDDRRLFRTSGKPMQHRPPGSVDLLVEPEPHAQKSLGQQDSAQARSGRASPIKRTHPPVPPAQHSSSRTVAFSDRPPLRIPGTFTSRIASTPAQHRASGDFQRPALLRNRSSAAQNQRTSLERMPTIRSTLPLPISRPGLGYREGSRMLSFFRKTAFKKDVFVNTRGNNTPISQSTTPEIKISSHDDQTSPVVTSPYFANHRGHIPESTGSSSHISPMSSGQYHIRPHHTRSSSELSPLSMPRERSRPKVRHRQTLDSFEDENDTTDINSEPQVVAASAELRPSPATERSWDGTEKHAGLRHQQSCKHLGSASLLRSKLDSLTNKVRRSVSVNTLRRIPLHPFKSTNSLVGQSEGSTSWMSQIFQQEQHEERGSRSRANSEDHMSNNQWQQHLANGYIITASDLEVTAFEQTPFSQRYYDAIRAEQSLIRTLVEEAMAEDNEEEAEVLLGFEVDVPDHLPGSMLCPLHPGHKSGGKAICPLHGVYKKRKSYDASRRSRFSNALDAGEIRGAHRMEIVFDTSEQAKRKMGYFGSDGALDHVLLALQLAF